MPYQAQVYTSIQHIAFESPTFAANSAGNQAYKAKLEKIVPLPDTKDLSLDAQNRVMTVVKLVQDARNTLINNGTDSSTCLKVFTLPEFYFRPEKAEANCLDRSYSEKTKNAIVKNLRAKLSNPDYKHWLFVLGSVIWTVKLADIEGLPASFVNEQDKGVRNTCIMLKGGSEDAPIQLFDKVHLSGINEIRDAAWAAKNFNPLYQRPQVSWLFESLASRQKCLFKVDNLSICAEICLDHHDQLQVGKKTLVEINKKKSAFEPKEVVNLQFVIACGMTIKPNSIATKAGGYLMRNDGHGGAKPFSQHVLIDYNAQDFQLFKTKDGKSLKRDDMLNIAYEDSQNTLNNQANRNNIKEALTYFAPQPIYA